MNRVKKTAAALSLLLILFNTLARPAQAIDFAAEKAYESVVVIYSGEVLGSGFAIGTNCIVTNAHVIDNVSQIRIATYDGDEHPATVVDMEEDLDIAVLRVDVSLPYLVIGSDRDARIGDDIYAIGAPRSLAYTLTKGILSAKDRRVGNHSYLQIDAAINSGNSGGPLLNARGEVIGMNTIKMMDSEGIGLSIPMTVICDFIRERGISLDENGNVQGEITASLPPGNKRDGTGEPSESTDNDSARLKVENARLVLVLAVSVVGNLVLLILLVAGKLRRKKAVSRNPYDFKIDFWE